MNSKNRITEFLNYIGIDPNTFEKKVGITNAYISKTKWSFGSAIIQKFSLTLMPPGF